MKWMLEICLPIFNLGRKQPSGNMNPKLWKFLLLCHNQYANDPKFAINPHFFLYLIIEDENDPKFAKYTHIFLYRK